MTSVPESASREFVDTTGTKWVVREIANPSMPPKLSSLLGSERRKGGWLVFEAESEKRRLSPYPSDWREISEVELNRCCARADRVPPAPARRKPDE